MFNEINFIKMIVTYAMVLWINAYCKNHASVVSFDRPEWSSGGIMFRHFVRTQDISRDDLDRLLFHARNLHIWSFDEARKAEVRMRLAGKKVNIVFNEPSTRTAESFVAAAEDLGATVHFTADASVTSSAVKGETFEHTVRMLAGYGPDVLVIRHKEEGRLAEAVKIINQYRYRTCIINAGDGPGQHPTQALLDIYTILQQLGRIGHIRIMMGGDLKHGRTVRSLAYLLSKYKDVEIVFAAPTELQISQDILDHLDEMGVKWTLAGANFRELLPRMHVVYWTRLQVERITHKKKKIQAQLRKDLEDIQRQQFCIDAGEMALMRSDAILMHPLPINDKVREISLAAERDPRCVIMQQAENGKLVRMALLDILVNGWPTY